MYSNKYNLINIVIKIIENKNNQLNNLIKINNCKNICHYFNYIYSICKYLKFDRFKIIVKCYIF